MPSRTCLRATLVAAVLAALAAPAALAINEMFAKDAPISRMTADDFEVAGAVMRKALDEGHDGQAYPWNNPATSASGTVTPMASFTRQGLHCRGAAFTITTRGQTSRSAWNLCRTPDGWKVAEGR
ncbi:MAG TPA: RT0821/Lpp0805 family surface protein [Usitatibacter sp.]|jgi:surface antigen|nr:RT0821/Lpp0805 family surface protein [Usitatibacter sp.]